MLVKCPDCQQTHTRPEDELTRVVRAGVIAYVDALCPWCRFAYNVGNALKSPFGAILCGIAIGAVALKIRESLN
jgi:hypothetical protein